MAPDRRDNPRGARPLDHDFSPPFFRWLRRLPETQLAATTASAAFVPAPMQPAFLRAPPNIATPPTSARPPAQISRSTAPGIHPAGNALRPVAAMRELASLFLAVPTTLALKLATSVPSFFYLRA